MHFQNNFRDLLETLLDWDVPQEAIADAYRLLTGDPAALSTAAHAPTDAGNQHDLVF